MQTQELKKLTVAELKDKLSENREELFKLRFRHSTAQLENTASIPRVKKTVARIMTVLKEKETEA